MDFSTRVQEAYAVLSEADRLTAQYIRSHMQETAASSITELAKKASSSRSSISRLSQKLGYTGYSQMKYAIAQELSYERQKEGLNDFRAEVDLHFSMAEQYHFEPLLKKIKDARKFIIYPTGTVQRLYCQIFSGNLFQAGRENYVMEAGPDLICMFEHLNEEDLVLIVSVSGENAKMEKGIQILKERRVPIVSLTEIGGNFLSSQADYSLYMKYCPLPGASGGSIFGMGMMLEILYRNYIDYAGLT